MAAERDRARAEVARRGLTNVAVERIVRESFATTPVSLVDRARTQLRRFFSDAPWTSGDDGALAAVAGPGRGWNTDELDGGVTVEHGWRGSTFRVDVRVAPGEAPTATAAAAANETEYPRSLGDTFEDPLVLESGRTDTEMRFITGVRAGTTLNASRDAPGDDPRVRALFDAFPDVVAVHLEPGTVSVQIGDPARWEHVLLALFDAISAAFITARPPATDRQLERAKADIGRLDPTDSRDIAKILDALTSPDAAVRRVAVSLLARAETVVAQRPWAVAVEDSSRPVRRAAARAMAHADAPPPRAPLDRAIDDPDPCVRYYVLRGISRIGVGSSAPGVDRRRRDDDPRVRLAAQAAVQGRPPA